MVASLKMGGATPTISFNRLEAMKKIWIFMFALLAIVSCRNDDEPGPATQEQLEALTGHWYAELPLSGETFNWRTLEEGDMASYDNVGVVIYLNGYNPNGDASYWGYLYLQDGDMVNFTGLLSESHEQSSFSFTMDSEGNIKPSSHLKDAPEVKTMYYDRTKDIITANVIYQGQTYYLTFIRPTGDSETHLNDIFDMLIEAGEIGGYDDKGNQLNTDVDNGNATEPSRVKSHSPMQP